MKIAIVTGASSGLGRAFVRQLDREGGLDEIWGVARRAGRMEELAGELSTPMRVLALDLIREESALELRDLLERASIQQPVLVAITDGTAEVTLNLMVAFGARVPALAEKVQKNVKSAIQNMTGVTVSRVNIVIAGVAGTSAPAAG